MCLLTGKCFLFSFILNNFYISDVICFLNSNVFYSIFRQLIYNYPEQLFADSGCMAIEHADFDGIERLALVTGGEIVSTFDNPELVKLGHCKVIEEVSQSLYIATHNYLELWLCFSFNMAVINTNNVLSWPSKRQKVTHINYYFKA